MHRISLFILICICAVSLQAQDQILDVVASEGLAVIKDSDGYTNVREAPEASAPIISTLTEDEVFLVKKKEGNWYFIAFNKKGEDGKGYVHQSRLAWLKETPRFSFNKLSEYKDEYTNACVTVTIEAAPFEKGNHNFDSEDERDVSKIDGQKIWGTDGGIPDIEIRRISVQGALGQIDLPAQAFFNTFELNFGYANIYLTDRGQLIISMENSDGAGAYQVIWVVRNLKYVNRYFGILF